MTLSLQLSLFPGNLDTKCFLFILLSQFLWLGQWPNEIQHFCRGKKSKGKKLTIWFLKVTEKGRFEKEKRKQFITLINPKETNRLKGLSSKFKRNIPKNKAMAQVN